VATLGLIAAVPITTGLAAIVTITGRSATRHVPRPRTDRADVLAALADTPRATDTRSGPASAEW
jgi:hypothetical protein